MTVAGAFGLTTLIFVILAVVCFAAGTTALSPQSEARWGRAGIASMTVAVVAACLAVWIWAFTS